MLIGILLFVSLILFLLSFVVKPSDPSCSSVVIGRFLFFRGLLVASAILALACAITRAVML